MTDVCGTPNVGARSVNLKEISVLHKPPSHPRLANVLGVPYGRRLSLRRLSSRTGIDEHSDGSQCSKDYYEVLFHNRHSVPANNLFPPKDPIF